MNGTRYEYYSNYTQADLYTKPYKNPYADKPFKKNKKSKKNKYKSYSGKKRSSRAKNSQQLSQIISGLLIFLLLFKVFPYSFKNYVVDLFTTNTKTVLKTNYYKLLFPTHSYLYKDLFLGKYVMKETEYKKSRMKDIQESAERTGLRNSLLSLANEYPTIKPAVYVWDYSGKTFVDIKADEVYPAASIIKIPVLIQMFREIDAGKYSLNDSMTLENYYRADGSGKLKNVPGRLPYSIDYLAEVMIENSDNSATNMLMAKSGGMPEVNRAIRMWGLKNTRINNWLPDLEGTNVTTAREMAKMLYNLDVSDIIKPASKQRAGYYLSHVKNNRLLQAGLPQDAILLHKTGDIGFMLGDAGIVKTAGGKKYIVVILAQRPYNSPKGKEFIVRASKMIYENIAYNR